MKRAPLRDKKNKMVYEESEVEDRDMNQIRPFYFPIRDAFVAVSDGKDSPSSQVRKLCARLSSIANDEASVDKFFLDVRHFSMYSIVVGQREPVVERTIKFIADLCTYRPSNKKGKSDAKENNDGGDANDAIFKGDNPILARMLNFALDNQNAADKAVRFRLCQIINLCLENLGEDADLDDDIFDRLLEVLPKRMKDRNPTIRQQAALALHRLQDPSSKDCKVIQIFKFFVSCDPVADVRRQIVSLIALTSNTLPEIIRRTVDTNESVRKAAYTVLSEKVGLKGFSIHRRLKLLRDGFQDTPRVKAVVENKLLLAWLRVCRNDKIELLKHLDVEDEPKLMLKILHSIFKLSKSPEEIDELIQEFRGAYLNEDLLIADDKLCAETVFYWGALARYLSKTQDSDNRVSPTPSATSLDDNAEDGGIDVLGKLLPPSPQTFMEYLKSYLDKLKKVEDLNASQEELDEAMTADFTCEQLLSIVPVYDWSLFPNERKIMQEFLRNRVIDAKTPLLVIPPLLKQWRLLLEPGTEIQLVADILAEIQAPMGTEEEAKDLIISMTEAKVEVMEALQHVMELQDELDEAVKDKDFARAQKLQEQLDIKKKIHEEKKCKFEAAQADKESLVPERTEKRVHNVEDENVLQHCLTILSDTLEKTQDTISKKELLLPTLQEMVPGLILKGVICQSPVVRSIAIRCLGLICLYSIRQAREHLDLFFQATLLDTTKVKTAALQAIFDCLLIYGIAAFSETKVRCGEPSGISATESVDDDEEAEEGDQDEDPDNPQEEDPFQEAYELNSSRQSSGVGDKSRFIRRKKKRRSDESNAESASSAARESEEMSNAVMTILVGCLDSDSVKIQEVTILGFAKLLLHDRIYSARLLSRFILLWFNPAAEDFKKYMSIFIEKYARRSVDHQEALMESLLPTLNQITKAPETSPLAKIDIDKVCALVVRITSSFVLYEKAEKPVGSSENSVHDNLALLLANEILKNPQGPLTRPFLTALNSLQLTSNNLDLLENLNVLAHQLVETPKDRFIKRVARKFQTEVEALLSAAKESAAGPSLDESLDTGEINISQKSVAVSVNNKLVNDSVEDEQNKSPMEEDDVDEADLEQEELEEDKDEEETSLKRKVRQDVRAKRSLGKIVAEMEDNQGFPDLASGSGESISSKATRSTAQGKHKHSPSSNVTTSNDDSESSSSNKRKPAKKKRKKSGKSGNK